jgi:hypothetical protein
MLFRGAVGPGRREDPGHSPWPNAFPTIGLDRLYLQHRFDLRIEFPDADDETLTCP